VKIPKDAADAFCARPRDGLVAVLIYGDASLVSDRCERLRSAWSAGSDAEVAQLSGETLRRDPTALDTAMRSDSLFAARRCVIVANATDGVAPAFAGVLDAASEDTRLIVTAGSLNAGSKLRKAFETSARAAAVQSYDAPLTHQAVAEMLEEAGAGEITSDAMTALLRAAETLDRSALRSELEKLVLLTAGGPVGAEDVAMSMGAARAAPLDAALDAALAGRPAELRRVLARAWIGGQTPDAAASALMRRLRALRGALAIASGEGCDVETALGRLSPPIRFPMNQSYIRHAALWSAPALDAALAQVLSAQKLMRDKTPVPAASVVERAMIRVAMLARR